MRDTEDHRQRMRALTSQGGPLSSAGPTASTSNPAWFRQMNGRMEATEQRKQLHDRIIGSALGEGDHGPSESGIPQARILTGPPGAGKSTVRGRTIDLNRSGVVIIDADDVKRQLLLESVADDSFDAWLKRNQVRDFEAQGARFVPLEFSGLVHRESVMIAQRIRDRAAKAKRDLVLDTTMPSLAGASTLGRVLRKPGHTIHLVDVEAPLPFLLQQVDERWRIGRERQLDGDLPDGQLGGRWISPDTVAEYFPDPDGPSTSSAVAAEFARSDSRVVAFERFWRDAEHPDGIRLDRSAAAEADRATLRPATPRAARDDRRATRADRGGSIGR